MKQDYEAFGDYILLEKLASGGMAEVYLAKKMASSGVQKFVAIKRILQQFSDSKDFIAMFKDEAKIAINLSHSNVVSIHDFGIQDSQFYIVMEFVEGRNLRQILNRMKKLKQQFSIAQVTHTIKQVTEGLDYAHNCIDPTTGQALNIIHRDISPQNIMLSFEGNAKIVDFGIAKAAYQIESTQAGTLKGKFGYMSPEQVEGQIVDRRTDIFALGIMIWEMLANQRLFLANNEINTLRKIRECDVPRLRDINPNIPLDLDKIVQRALKKDKSERYKTAFDMHRDLQSFLSRFEPDFSTKDISQFVRELFSEEILNIRKKQMTYAQVKIKSDSEEKIERTEKAEISDSTTERTDVSGLSKGKQILLDELSMPHDSMSYEIDSKEATGVTSIISDIQKDNTKKGKSKRDMVIARSKARKNAKEYHRSNYTYINNATVQLEKKNRKNNFLTLIFCSSFIFVLLAYINKFHPDLRQKFCRSVENYNFCPRALYTPSNVLKIITFPPGAQIHVNNENLGEAPKEFVVNKLPLNLSIYKKGYQPENKVIRKISSDNKLELKLAPLSTGYIKIKSIGVQIFVNGKQVKSGQKVGVPANKRVSVRIINPLTGTFKDQFVFVKNNELKSLFIEPPTR